MISEEYWEKMRKLKGYKYDPNKICPTCGQIMRIKEKEEDANE